MAMLQTHETAEAALIRIHYDFEAFIPRVADAIVRVRVGGMEVEDKEAIPALEDEDLVHLIAARAELMLGAQKLESVLESLHDLIEGLEVLELQVVSVWQVEAPPAMPIAPTIPLAWEINPLWVAELIADEVQVAFTAKAESDQTDHLVERKPSVDNHAGRAERAHVSVHLGIHQPEGHSLVAHNGLIVGLGVCDALLLPSTILQCVCNVTHIPLVIGALLQDLDPHIWYRHGQPVVEPKASIRSRSAKSWHARHILRNSDSCVWQQAMDEVIGEHQVYV
mmetsp:Transcript_66966/g.160398  ORF Transcript_66966/g.160398 Transcript_66966/m.160398 type:complete len:280 (-) Transcript_66966:1218-2057(-)